MNARPETVAIVTRDYEPWWGQRLVHRSLAPIRVIVAARQVGKTVCAAREVVRIMLARPGSTSCLLMPVKGATVGPIKHLRAALESALGPEDGRWDFFSSDHYFRLWNGAELYVRTCDTEARRGLPTRGLTLDGVLWVDEAAYVPRTAWEAARLTLAAVADPKVIVTTTPCGRNWVYEEFQAGAGAAAKRPGAMNESFRFRSTQSPFCNPQFIEDTRKRLGAKRALQELEAVFLGDGGSVFPQDQVDKLLPGAAMAFRGAQMTIGLDLAKEKDYTVATLMNELGEAWLLWRVRHVAWPDQETRLVEYAQMHKALVVVDVGHGGGYGGTMSDYLRRALGDVRVLEVRTGNRGVKAQVVETLCADMEAGRLRMDAGDEVEVVRNELLFFAGARHVVGGTEMWTYGSAGSQPDAPLPGVGEMEDHDDCVISLALANWGRLHGWEPDSGDGGIAAFKVRSGPSKSPTAVARGATGLRGGGRTGYMLR